MAAFKEAQSTSQPVQGHRAEGHPEVERQAVLEGHGGKLAGRLGQTERGGSGLGGDTSVFYSLGVKVRLRLPIRGVG